MRSFVILLAFAASLSAADLAMTTSDIEVSVGQRGMLELTLSGGIAFAASNPERFGTPGACEITVDWLKIRRDNVAFNFASGLFASFTLYHRGQGIWDARGNTAGVSIMKLEPEVFMSERVSVFLETSVIAFDFVHNDLLIGTFADLPSTKVGIRWSL